MTLTIQPIYDNHKKLTDIAVQRANGLLYMLGTGGVEREYTITQHADYTGKLPVLLGMGLGHALRNILHCYDGPVAIVDKETDIQSLTQVLENLPPKDAARCFCISTADEKLALQQLTYWQEKHNCLPFLPLPHPFYLRLDKKWYSTIRQHVEASKNIDFWGRVRQPRFTKASPRVLLITSKYFLIGELLTACQRLGIEHKLLTLPEEGIASNIFIDNLLKEALEFKPDCLLTLNHMGVDREGVLTNLLSQLQLPIASWFVDNPLLIVHLYKNLISPWVSIFTWDADNIAPLRALNFEHVFYLPLGTDPERFKPESTGKAAWKRSISFVGNSMVARVEGRLKAACFPLEQHAHFQDVAAHFNISNERSVPHFLQQHYPETYETCITSVDNERRLAFEAAVTWEATRTYRASCVEKILPFSPLIVGDSGWQEIFKGHPHQPLLHDAINYYEELPAFYPCSDINFNCTSRQMKGAVNQRIFDVPACNAFVLTDWREQMDALFEPRKEIIFYTEQEEIPELVRYYLAHPIERQTIVTAARTRVLAEHTWEHRLQTLLTKMREVYGS